MSRGGLRGSPKSSQFLSHLNGIKSLKLIRSLLSRLPTKSRQYSHFS